MMTRGPVLVCDSVSGNIYMSTLSFVNGATIKGVSFGRQRPDFPAGRQMH